MDIQPTVEQLINTLKANFITNQEVLDAFRKVPRELFVRKSDLAWAYENRAMPIESGQTISQPYIIALMTQALLEKSPMNKVLEIGTGSGYQAAILSQVVDQVYTIERIENLYQHSKQLLQRLGYRNVHTHFGDGHLGWPDEAPFDGILVTAAPEDIPPALLQQLNPQGGRMVIPVGGHGSQKLYTVDRNQDQFKQHIIENVVFVPLLPGQETS